MKLWRLKRVARRFEGSSAFIFRVNWPKKLACKCDSSCSIMSRQGGEGVTGGCKNWVLKSCTVVTGSCAADACCTAVTVFCLRDTCIFVFLSSLQTAEKSRCNSA